MLNLKTEYKHIKFYQGESEIWWCESNDKTLLGCVAFFTKWHQFVFSQCGDDRIFSKSCLLDIVDFIDQLNKAHNESELCICKTEDRDGTVQDR